MSYSQDNKDYITSSKLSTLRTYGPSAYKAKYIDMLIPEKSTPSLELGNMLHKACELGFDEFFNKYIILEPNAKRKEREDGKIEVTNSDGSKLLAAINCISKQPILDIGGKYENEKEFIVKYKGKLLKAKIDRYSESDNIIGGPLIRDYKFTSNIGKFISDYYESFIYQMAFYAKVVNIATGLKPNVIVDIISHKGEYYPQETCYNYSTLEQFFEKIDEEIETIIQCEKNGLYPNKEGISFIDTEYYEYMDSSIIKTINFK